MPVLDLSFPDNIFPGEAVRLLPVRVWVLLTPIMTACNGRFPLKKRPLSTVMSGEVLTQSPQMI